MRRVLRNVNNVKKRELKMWKHVCLWMDQIKTMWMHLATSSSIPLLSPELITCQVDGYLQHHPCKITWSMFRKTKIISSFYLAIMINIYFLVIEYFCKYYWINLLFCVKISTIFPSSISNLVFNLILYFHRERFAIWTTKNISILHLIQSLFLLLVLYQRFFPKKIILKIVYKSGTKRKLESPIEPNSLTWQNVKSKVICWIWNQSDFETLQWFLS